MKKTYSYPEMKITGFSETDIVTTSGLTSNTTEIRLKEPKPAAWTIRASNLHGRTYSSVNMLCGLSAP